MSERKATVFLDRDGVVNDLASNPESGAWESPHRPAEVSLRPGAAAAIARLRGAGFGVVVVSNQPSAAKGKCSLEDLASVHARVVELLSAEGAAVDAYYYCHHHPDGVVAGLAGPCACRKPAPGLLERACAESGLGLAGSWLVGDRESDVECGRRAGVRTILVHHPRTPVDPARCRPDYAVDGLAAAADIILNEESQRMTPLENLRVKIFADGADLAGMVEMYRLPYIRGFTTNPTLMRKAGVADYKTFALDVLRAIPDRPVSFEVFSDEFDEMEHQAREIATWGPNVYVKIPVTNTRREPSYALVRDLARAGVKQNVTALMTPGQVAAVTAAVAGGPPCCISVFAGRIADTGRDPLPLLSESLEIMRRAPNAELIWASPRELLNVFQAHAIGCHIITVTNDILKKLPLVGKDLEDYSLETVRMFHEDAKRAGFELATHARAGLSA